MVPLLSHPRVACFSRFCIEYDTCCRRQDMTYLNLARYLDQFRGKFPVFSDDIQGAICMFTICSACCSSKVALCRQLMVSSSAHQALTNQSDDKAEADPAAWPAAGMAAVVLGGVMAAQPLTGRSLAQHTYMFAGEVRHGWLPCRKYYWAMPRLVHMTAECN